MMYCSPKKVTSGNLPPRDSKYEYTVVVPGGYCRQWDVCVRRASGGDSTNSGWCGGAAVRLVRVRKDHDVVKD